MDREAILSEIQRLASENGGRPLGKRRFEDATGIRESDWLGRYWLRWGDAVREAGLEPNTLQSKFDDDEVLASLALLVRDLGHFPVEAELRMRAREDAAFPSHGTVQRLGNKATRASRLLDYCDRVGGLEDVREVCEPLATEAQTLDEADTSDDETSTRAGFVYLMKSGKHYKIGRSNSVGRRHYELAIQLPERVELVHVIETDDAPGIEAYWHNRFAAQRANGEWFALSQADVRAFRRRRKFM
jgi:hypothetical protein